MFQEDATLQIHLEAAIHDPETFKNISDFLAAQK